MNNMPYLMFLLLLILPVAIYKIRLLRANVRVCETDVNSGFRSNLVKVMAGVNLSIKHHILLFYAAYVICLSLIAILKPNVAVFSAIQILNILIIACFIWLLIRPFPESFRVVSQITLDENGHVDVNKRKHNFIHTKAYETTIVLKFSHGLNRTRGVLYEGFSKYVRRQDILSYLRLKATQYAHERQYVNVTSAYVNDIQRNKGMLYCVFILTLLTNYVVLYSGTESHMLHFRDMGNDYVDPLYYILTTFGTVGYGDIVPISHIDKLITSSLILQLVLFIFVLVNIVNDQSALAAEMLNRPFKEVYDLLLSEANILIHDVETGAFDKHIDSAIERFRLNTEIGFHLLQYRRVLDRSDTYSI